MGIFAPVSAYDAGEWGVMSKWSVEKKQWFLYLTS